MTDRQQQILDLIKAFYKKNKYACQQTYLTSLLGGGKSNMNRHIDVLVKKGVVKRTEGGQVMPV
jgi:DNA-binding MarR family transcriptional regulator